MHVFFSWQSDREPNLTQRPIREELKSACLALEKEHTETRFYYDEATLDRSGSPNIMQAIFGKISRADAFVCDLTPVAYLEREGRKKAIANPNVLIELGFAVAELGWERIIMLVNTHLGTIPDDLPFDVEKHRASPFKIVEHKDKNGRAGLRTLLKTAIAEISRRNPPKPAETREETPESRARRRDIRALKSLMEIMPIRQIEECVGYLPDRYPSDLHGYHASFEYIVGSSEYYLSCETTASLLRGLRAAWTRLDHYDVYFFSDFGQHARFEIKPYELSPREYKEGTTAYDKLRRDRSDFLKKFEGWVHHLNTEYPEIDLTETSGAARLYYEDLERRVEASFLSSRDEVPEN